MFKTIKKSINLKVLLGAVIFAACVFALLLLILWSSKVNSITQVPATALLSIIEASTETPPAPAIAITPTSDIISTRQSTQTGSVIKIGDFVQVSGTGGDGLRLHESAGVSGKVDYVAIDSEVFLVEAGPTNADDYNWWLLQDPFTKNTVGWGVANYLVVIQNP